MGSYGYNADGDNRHDLGAQAWYFAEARVKSSMIQVPSDMIAVGDSWIIPIDDTWPYNLYGLTQKQPYNSLVMFIKPIVLSYWALSKQGPASAAMKSRHGGTFNIGLLDGHAETAKYSSITNVGDDNLRRWDRDHEPNH